VSGCFITYMYVTDDLLQICWWTLYRLKL